MDLTPLFAAPLVVQVHAYCALTALLLGAVQLSRRKGTTQHRVLGYVWVTLMVVIAVSSFGIHEINHWRGFSAIHLLSVLTLVTVPLALLAARRGDIASHKRNMLILFWSALVLAGLFTLMPGRILYRVLVG